MNFEGDLAAHFEAMKDRVPRRPHVVHANKETKMRNRDHVWRSGNGREERLEDMDNDHLVNLLCWLQRQSASLNEMDVRLPKKYMQGSDVYTWFERVAQELDRRRRKEVKEAQEILGQ